MPHQVLVIGDDLTGSNATGAGFARAGLRTVSVSGGGRIACARDADVVVVNTGTRHDDPDRARARVREAAEAVPASQVRLLVKRVDTTLRGNVGAEVDALLALLDPTDPTDPTSPSDPIDPIDPADPKGPRALVVPAFPDAGRTTVGGLHLVDGVPLTETSAGRDPFTPVRSSRVADVLREGTSRSVAELPLDVVQSGARAVADVLAGTAARLVVCDATRSAHLGAIADGAALAQREHGTRWLSVDSGPFAVRLATALGIGSGPRTAPPLLAVVGSITATTRDQVLETEQVLGARFVDVGGAGRDDDHGDDGADLDPRAVADRAAELVRAGAGIVGIRARMDTASADPATAAGPATTTDPSVAARLPDVLARAAALLLAEHRFGGLYVTGGDIAEAVTRALDSDGFAIDTEVLPLAVAGQLVGGDHDGLPFATKGGLIGDRTATVACLEHLAAVQAHRERARNDAAPREAAPREGETASV